jgi:hypothetical protein
MAVLRRYRLVMPRVARPAVRIQGWPSAAWLAWFDRRLGLYLVSIAAVVGLKWRGAYDLGAYLDAARDVAAGGGAYDATLAAGVASWGTGQVYVSPPFLAHALAPFSGLPRDAVFWAWALAGLGVLALATRAVSPGALARRMPRLVFGLAYLWASTFLGQVNLLVLAGLLLALDGRRDALAGAGLAVATLIRGTPAAFAILFIVQRRWRALGWSLVWLAIGVVVSGPGDWATYARVLADAALLPPLDVPPQASPAAFAPLLRPLAAAALAAIVLLAHRVPAERDMLVATAIGLAIVVIPANSWYHWYLFGIVGLLVWGDRALWSRRALVAFLGSGFVLMGWPSTLVALAVVAVMLARVLRPPIGADQRGDPASLETGTLPRGW